MKKSLLLSALALGVCASASAQFDSKLVVEEATGAWCGYCPRGIVAFNEMNANHPGEFIGIAIHSDDEMAYDAYLNYLRRQYPNNISGFPSCVNNRNAELGYVPMTSYLEQAFKQIAKNKVNGKVEITEVSLSDDKKTIKVKVKSTFAQTLDAKYNLLLVMTENNVNGTYQSNYFAGGGMGVMGGFENMPSKISPFTFQHVARGVYPENNFAGEEIATAVTEGQVIEKEYSFAMPSTVVTPYFVDVNAILLEGGVIINGDEKPVADVKRELPEVSTELTAGAYVDAGLRFEIELKNPTDQVIYTSYRVALDEATRAGVSYVSSPKVVLLEPNETKMVQCEEKFDDLKAGAYVLTVEATNSDNEYVPVGKPLDVTVAVREAATLKCDWAKVGENITDYEKVPASAKFTCEEGTFYYRLTFRFHPKDEKKPLATVATSYMLIEKGESVEVNVDANLKKLKDYDNLVMDVTTMDANKKTVYLVQDVPFSIDWAGVNTIDADINNQPVEYYDLQGRRVVEPTNGIYIRRQGKNVEKVIIH